MKTLIASALIALSLLSTAISAQAATSGDFSDYPGWAERAFEQGRNGY